MNYFVLAGLLSVLYICVMVTLMLFREKGIQHAPRCLHCGDLCFSLEDLTKHERICPNAHSQGVCSVV